MQKKNYTKFLVLILLIGLVLRLAPVYLYGTQMSYDAPYHQRIAEKVFETKTIPKTDESLGGRENIYPPLYSVFQNIMHYSTGFDFFLIGMILLPIISLLTVLSVYVFVRKISGERKALIAAFLTAVSSSLIAYAFDSPENFVFFLLPAIIFFFNEKKEKLGAVIYASGLLWNYLIIIASVVPLMVYLRKKTKDLVLVISGLILVLLYYLVFHGESFLYNQDVNLAMDFVSLSFKPAFYVSVLITYLLIIPLIYFIYKNKIEEKANYWKYFIALSLIALTTVFLTPFLRVWEQIKFLSLSSIIAIGAIKVFDKKMKIYVLAYALILLCSSFVMSFQGFYPSAQKEDFYSMEFLQDFTQEGAILAEPSFSEHIRNSTLIEENRILTSLYFENAGNNSFLKESLHYLTFQGIENEKKFFEESNLRFIVFNFEDKAVRNTEEIEEKETFNKIYSAKYYRNCLIQSKEI
ncbi:hypothetical protein KKG83_04605, partial [Candidatus Micrarchaeota archaeon]|nr:hypothetical protein [Candidatus Micrarchaeota archaeon]